MRNYLGKNAVSAGDSLYAAPGGYANPGAVLADQNVYKQPIILNDNTIPSPDEFDDLLNPMPASSDIVWWAYYDSVAIPSASSKTGSLFINPNNSSPWLSNLTNSGRLQGDERMLMTALRIEIWNDSSTLSTNIVTVKEILRQFYCTFWLANKPYTSHNGFQFLDPLSPLIVNTANYALRPYIGIELPLRLAIAENITFRLDYQLGTTPSLSGNWYLYAYIVGALYRGVQ